MLSKEENQLIKIQTLFFFTSSLASVFLQIFLFKLAGFYQVVLFNLTQLIFLLIFYFLSGWGLKKVPTRILISVGLFFFSIGFLLLLILKENSINYIFLLGMIFGIGHGNYWSGFNLSQYLLTASKSREFYFGKSFAGINFASSLGPVLAGMIILIGNKLIISAFAGYYLLFLLVFILYFFTFLLSYNLPYHSGIDFSPIQILKHIRSPNWNLVLKVNFIYGLWDHLFNTLSAILFFTILRNETTVGLVTTLMSLLAAVISFNAGRLMAKYKKIFIFAAVMTSLGIFFFGLWQNWLGIILLGFLSGLGSPILNIKNGAVILDSIDEYRDPWQKKYYLLLERDGVLGTARILSYIFVFILFTFWNKIAVAKNLVIFLSIFPFIIGYFFMKVKNLKI